MTPEDVVKLIEKENVQIIDLKFNDLPGLWQHFSMPVSEVTGFEDASKSIWGEGAGFDGSSIRGFQKIQESDMILMLDPDTAMVDPISSLTIGSQTPESRKRTKTRVSPDKPSTAPRLGAAVRSV